MSSPRLQNIASSLAFQAGDRLADRYIIRALLGKGAMGEVFEAWDEGLGIPVALKVLFGPAPWHERLNLLRREVLLARSVGHPNVCRVYDLGRHTVEDEAAVWFLTMQLIRGETLKDRIVRLGRLEPHAAFPLLEGIASGISAAHRAGIVHRDLKCANVMITQDDNGADAEERAVVTDFGLARAMRHSGEDDFAFAGTPAYMSPEQVRGEDAGPAADIYAFGVLLFETMTGALPFTGSTAREIARKRLTDNPPRPKTLSPDLDDSWESVILRCMERDARSRFEAVEDVIDALAGEVRPRLVPAMRRTQTLPPELDDFLGRKVETEALDHYWKSGARLITIVGPAGVGKTRLAIHYAWQGHTQWSGGIAFCDLTLTGSLEDVAVAIARALGLATTGSDPVEHVADVLSTRGPCLVILDNAEGVIEHTRAVLGKWIGCASESRWLVTTRQRLNLSGEIVLDIEPLDTDAALELFIQRARWHRPAIVFGPEELADAREIMCVTECLPLSIELAASRLPLMTTGQLRSRITERLAILGRGGDASGRHSSLEAAIDWSWRLLAPWEKAAFAQCSVFEGGFMLDAAEAVLELVAWPEAPSTLDVVQSLLNKSMLRIVHSPRTEPARPQAEVRLGMFESLRDYAHRSLARGEVLPAGSYGATAERAAEERHGRWYARYGTEESLLAMLGAGEHSARNLAPELRNVLAASSRAINREDAATVASTLRAAWRLQRVRGGPYDEFLRLVKEGLAVADDGENRWALIRILGQGASLMARREEALAYTLEALKIARATGNERMEGQVLGDLANIHRELEGRTEEARAAYEAAITLHRRTGNLVDEGISVGNLAVLNFEQGHNEEACKLFRSALEIHRRVGNRANEGSVLGNLANALLDLGHIAEAESTFHDALVVARDTGDRRAEGVILGNLGELYSEGHPDEAIASYAAALSIHRDIGNLRSEGVVLGNMGDLYRKQRRRSEAREYLERSLSIHRHAGNTRFEGIVLGSLGTLAFDEGRLDEAQVRFEEALAVHRRIGDNRFEAIVLGELGHLEMERDKFGMARELLTRAEQRLRELGDLRHLAVVLCVRAELERRCDDRTGARDRLAEAEALVNQAQVHQASHLRREIERIGDLLGRW